MTIPETIARDEVAELNRNALTAVLLETGYPIPAAAYAAWRPTERVTGVIPGMPVRVTCVATDGNLGLFVPTSGGAVSNKGDAVSNAAQTFSYLGSAFLGHVHRFEWGDGEVGCPPTLHRMQKPETEKKPKVKKLSRRQQILNSL